MKHMHIIHRSDMELFPGENAVEHVLGGARAGFTFAELIIAVFVFSIISVPLYLLLSSTRTDTAKSINFMRAMELAQEGIEWVQLTENDQNFRLNAENFSGGLVMENGASFKPAEVMVAGNNRYGNQLLPTVQYSEQYNTAWFYRMIKVEDVKGTQKYCRLLKKVRVSVFWNDGKKVKNLHDASGRSKKVVLETLILDGKLLP